MSDSTVRPAKIATVIIPVADQDRAVDFYVGRLGFEKRVEIPFGDGYRWIEVGLGDQATTIALAPPPGAGGAGGRQTGISLHVPDIDGYHRQLSQAGVDVDAEITRPGDPVPPMFWFRDAEGNSLMAVG